ncbi:MAG: zinc ribbon domain-containing protein [Thiobacillaceae bacterium]
MNQHNAGYCPRCGEPLAAGQRFCGQCGNDRAAELEPAEVSAAPEARVGRAGLTWEAEIGLLTNPLILRQLVTMLAVTGVMVFALLAFLFAVQGEWESIPMVLAMTLLGVGVLAVLMLLVIVLFFGNRYRMRFAVDEKGVLVQTVDRRARAGNRLAALLGALGGSATTAGAGLMGMVREQEAASWKGIARAAYHPRWRGITLHNRWRTVAFLACTRDNYEPVAAFVQRQMAAKGAGTTAKAGSPLPRLLGRSALVVLATVPVFLLPYPFELDLLVPLIMLCFALATVWLVPLFGWVVIAAALWIVAEIVVIGASTRESIFSSLGTYRTYEILDTGDWFSLALAAAGLAYLVAFSWRAVRGRVPSALIEDHDEMDD